MVLVLVLVLVLVRGDLGGVSTKMHHLHQIAWLLQLQASSRQKLKVPRALVQHACSRATLVQHASCVRRTRAERGRFGLVKLHTLGFFWTK